MINYNYQIEGKVIQLEDDLNISGISAICKSENAVCKGVRIKEYYKGLTKIKNVTYIFEKNPNR